MVRSIYRGSPGQSENPEARLMGARLKEPGCLGFILPGENLECSEQGDKVSGKTKTS